MDSRGPEADGNPHNNSDSGDVWARDRHGHIIRDRFGRPVRKRTVDTPGTPADSGIRHNRANETRILDPRRGPTPPAESPAHPGGYLNSSGSGQGQSGHYRGSGGYSSNRQPQASHSRQNQPQQQGLPPQQPGYHQQPGYPQQPTGQGHYPPPSGWQHNQPPVYAPAAVPPAVPGVPAPPPHKQRRPRRRRGCGCGCFTGVVLPLVVIFALLVAGMLFVDAKLPRVAATPPEQVAQTAGTNWLLVGSDSRRGLTPEQEQQLGTGGDLGSSRTDTIMLVHIPGSGQATLLSIPRDSYVEVPGYGMNKINASFAFGGPQLLVQTVENATGLRIDHYAEVGFGGFAGIVDAIGGVDMCIREAINDPLANIDLGPGCQKLAGPQALGYVRSRAFPRGDLDRVEHQREFFAALMDSATSPATLFNPFKLFPLIKRGMMSFTVGAGDHVWHLARLVWALRGGIITETVPIGDMGMTDVGSVVYWDQQQAGALFTNLGAG